MPDRVAALTSNLRRPKIPALDGLRACAVFLVLAYHFGFSWAPGSLGVMIFFVLSGFLITWLLLKEDEQTRNISLPGFYRRRMLRIFPAFYVYWALLITMLLAAGKPVLWGQAVSSLFYVSNYYNAIFGDPNNGLSHTWSLAIEEQFYLLWPFIFLVLRRDTSRLLRGLVVVIVGVWGYRTVLTFGMTVDAGYIYAAFDTRLDALMVGCLLAVILKRRACLSLWGLLLGRAWAPAITLGLLALSVFGGPHVFERYRDVVGFAVEPVLIAILMTQIVAFSDGLPWRWLSWGWVRFLGRISYSLYLYQQVVLDPARKLLLGYPVLVQFAGGVALTVCVAYLSFSLVERPFQRLRRRRQVEDPAGATAGPQTASGIRDTVPAQ